MKNAEWIWNQGWTLSGYYHTAYCNKKFAYEVNYLDWLDAEHIEGVLTSKEREYLRTFIAPFKDKILWICKKEDPDFKDTAYLCGKLAHHMDGDFELPNFDIDQMYKGMEQEKKYTPEELGL